MKRPISLIIDDPAPCLQVYYYHIDPPVTAYGDPLKREMPVSFLTDFCDVIEKYGIKGKFSVVPMAGGQGDLRHGYNGISKANTDKWLETVRKRVMPNFSICSEILSHHKALDLATGNWLDVKEDEWVRTHSLEEITDYVAFSLEQLRDAGLNPTGVTSPWYTGIEVEDTYAEAISRAFKQVLNKNDCWYFLHSTKELNVKPQLVKYEDGRRIVSIWATFADQGWPLIGKPGVTDEELERVADYFISADGSTGRIIDMLGDTGWPVLICHWQTLFSNGSRAGLKVLEIAASRIEKYLSDKVEWTDFAGLMRLTLA